MNKISDEMLMAYVDGQLAANDRVRVESYLATDPEARTRLQVFVDTGPALARALDAATARPIPDSLIDAVMFGRDALAHSGDRHGRLWKSGRDGREISESPFAGGQSAGGLSAAIGRGLFGLWPVAASAFAAMLVGVGIGWNMTTTGSRVLDGPLIVSGADGQLRAGKALGGILETVESGQVASLDQIHRDAFATPVLTFESRQATMCRQYRIGLPAGAGSGFEGLACRAADGTWRISVHAPADVRRPSHDRIAPASGGGQSIVDGVVDLLISGDALGRDEESRLLREKWMSGPSPAARGDHPPGK